MSFVDDLKNLDPNNPGLWPKAIQIVLYLILFFALLFAGWKFDITKQRDELAGLEEKENERLEILKVVRSFSSSFSTIPSRESNLVILGSIVLII